MCRSKTQPPLQLSDKTRIHELAKSYGMPGKDLASKLRENGFVQARSHMSALDSIELLQAKGLLAAIGKGHGKRHAPAQTQEKEGQHQCPRGRSLQYALGWTRSADCPRASASRGDQQPSPGIRGGGQHSP